MLAQTWVPMIWAIFQSRKSYGVIGKYFVSRSIEQLRRKQRVVRPSVFSLSAANGAEMVSCVISKGDPITRCREDAIDKYCVG